MGARKNTSGLSGLVLFLLLCLPNLIAAAKGSGKHWIDIWGSMPQLVEPHNLPNAPYVSFIDTILFISVFHSPLLPPWIPSPLNINKQMTVY